MTSHLPLALAAAVVLALPVAGAELPEPLRKALADARNLDLGGAPDAAVAALGDKPDLLGLENAEGLYLVELIKDHPPLGWGAAGTTRPVELRVAHVFRGEMQAGLRTKIPRPNPNNLNPQAKPNDDHKPGHYLVTTVVTRGRPMIDKLVPATAASVTAAAFASRLPVGWRVEKGKLANPWGEAGRAPALLGPDIDLVVEKVPPPKDIKWRNPDGDGLFEVKLVNKSGAEVVLPLECADHRIRWDAWVLAGARGAGFQSAAITRGDRSQQADKVTLRPGGSVSCVVNGLLLKGVDWPRGGYRIDLNFAVAEKMKTYSFYYYSDHHDPIRAAAGK